MFPVSITTDFIGTQKLNEIMKYCLIPFLTINSNSAPLIKLTELDTNVFSTSFTRFSIL